MKLDVNPRKTGKIVGCNIVYRLCNVITKINLKKENDQNSSFLYFESFNFFKFETLNPKPHH